MSGAASIREVDVSCPVCKEVYNSRSFIPKILPCNHTVCIKCLQTLYSGYNIKCPLCSVAHSTTVNSLQTNLTAQNIGDKYVPETTSTFSFGGFQISVKTMEDKTIQLDVTSSTTIGQVKKKIEEKEGLRPDYQRLMCMGKPLREDSKTLSSYGISRDANLHLFKRMLGGRRLNQ